MIVREYAPGDVEACRSLFAELLETHRELYPDVEIASVFALEGTAFVAEERGRVVGYAGLIWHGARAELEPIAVASGHRGRGVGRALAERVLDAAREGGAIRVFARPVGRNRNAFAFFHSVGFDVLGRVELQMDLEQRDRHAGERIGGRDFLV